MLILGRESLKVIQLQLSEIELLKTFINLIKTNVRYHW